LANTVKTVTFCENSVLDLRSLMSFIDNHYLPYSALSGQKYIFNITLASTFSLESYIWRPLWW